MVQIGTMPLCRASANRHRKVSPCLDLVEDRRRAANRSPGTSHLSDDVPGDLLARLAGVWVSYGPLNRGVSRGGFGGGKTPP